MPTAEERQSTRDIMAALEGFTAQVVIELVSTGVTRLYGDTPVDTGYARANWIPSLNPGRKRPVGKRNSAGVAAAESAQDAALVRIATQRRFLNPVFIGNFVAYISALNDGHSRQAPPGYVNTTVDRVLVEVATKFA